MKKKIKRIPVILLTLCCLLAVSAAAQKAELIVQTGHSNVVHSIAFSRDGRFLASAGGQDETVKIWDAAGGQELRTLKGHSSVVFSVAFSPDGKILASAGFDRTIRLWDAVGGKELRVLNFHVVQPSSLVFSPDGEMLAAAGADRTIRFWNVGDGSEMKVLDGGHTAGIKSIDFDPKGKILVSSGADKKINIWDVETGKVIRTLGDGSSVVNSVAFSPDGKTLAGAASDKTIKLWGAASGEQLQVLSGHDREAVSVAFSSDGNLLASVSSDDTIKLWDGREQRTLKGDTSQFSKVAFKPNSKVLAIAGGQDKTIALWDAGTGQKLRTLKGHTAEVTSVVFSADGKTLASVNRDKTIKLWDLAGRRELKNLSGHDRFIPAAAFSPEGEMLASVSWDRTIKLWNVSSGKMLESYELGNLPADLRGGNDQKLLEEFAGFYERNYGRPLKVYPEPVSERFVAQRVENGKINLLDRRTGEEVVSLIALDEEDWAVITPEGLFDASENGRKLMHYIVGLEPVTLEQMKDAYYVPGLLQKIYSGEPLPKVELFSKKDLFPEVEFQTPAEDPKDLTVRLKARGGGIGPVQVLLNGKEVVREAISPRDFDADAKEVELRVDLEKAATLIPGEENRIEVVARNRSGSLSSRGIRGTEVLVVGNGQKSKSAPDIYAIVAGISDYTGDDLDLRFAAKDAEDFARAVELGAISFLGDKSKVHIRLLTNRGRQSGVKFSAPDSISSTARKEDFQSAFADFRRAKPKDVFIVYLAGHGVSLNLGGDSGRVGGDAYLYLTQEATTTDKSVLGVENSRRAMTLSGDEIKDLMKQNGALKQVLILDTCAAGAYSSNLTGGRDLPSDQIRALERLKDSTGSYVLMGAAADAISYEASQYGQGLLTYSLLQAMKGARLRLNQFADVGLLFGYAQDTVPQLAKNIGGIQRPLVITPDVSGSFDIGKFTAEEQKQIALAGRKPLILRPNLQNEKLVIDDLNLTPLFRRELREASFSEEGGAMVFVDADEMPDAITPRGVYQVEGGILKIRVVLAKNNKLLGREIAVSGKESEKEELIKRLVEEIGAEIGELKK
ncbi:MAG: caspase family protein [Pyrinomonadaceae bacterium]